MTAPWLMGFSHFSHDFPTADYSQVVDATSFPIFPLFPLQNRTHRVRVREMAAQEICLKSEIAEPSIYPFQVGKVGKWETVTDQQLRPLLGWGNSGKSGKACNIKDLAQTCPEAR